MFGLTACRELCPAPAIMLQTGRPLQLQSAVHCLDPARIGRKGGAGGRPGNAPRIRATATLETPTLAVMCIPLVLRLQATCMVPKQMLVWQLDAGQIDDICRCTTPDASPSGILCLQKSNPLNLTDLERVSVLSEALPYMQRFRNKVIVVKYGGAAMKDASLKASLAQLISWLLHLSRLSPDTAQTTQTCGPCLKHAAMLLNNASLTLPGQAAVWLAVWPLVQASF